MAFMDKWKARIKRERAERILRKRHIKELGAKLIAMGSKMANLSNTMDVIIGKANELNDMLGEVEEDIKGTPPKTIRDLGAVLLFARWKFGDEVFEYKTPDQQEFCRRLTNAMAVHYPDVERLNDQGPRHGYTALESKHADAVYVPAAGIGYDICKRSKLPGKFIDNFALDPIKVLPWEVNNDQ